MADCDNTPKYIVLPTQGIGTIPGPQGPAGPQGPPGSIAGITAADIAVTNPGYANLQEVIDYLLYVPIAITSFVANNTVYEIGTTISQLGFTWLYNKSPIVSQDLTGPNDPIVLGILDRNATVNFTTPLGVTSVFNLEVDDGVDVVNKDETVSFFNGVYYGDAAEGTINSAFILALNKNLQATKNYSFSSTAGAGVYAWFAHKKSLGVANFNVGGFVGGFENPVTLSFTNASGYTEDYYVYRSTNAQIGPVNIIVS